MKFTQEDFEELERRIQKITLSMLEEHKKSVIKEGKYKDLETRLVWDIYWACGIDKHYLIPKYTLLNHPYTDAHIETATRKAIKKVGLALNYH